MDRHTPSMSLDAQEESTVQVSPFAPSHDDMSNYDTWSFTLSGAASDPIVHRELQTQTINGDTTGKPTFNRPSDAGTSRPTVLSGTFARYEVISPETYATIALREVK